MFSIYNMNIGDWTSVVSSFVKRESVLDDQCSGVISPGRYVGESCIGPGRYGGESCIDSGEYGGESCVRLNVKCEYPSTELLDPCGSPYSYTTGTQHIRENMDVPIDGESTGGGRGLVGGNPVIAQSTRLHRNDSQRSSGGCAYVCIVCPSEFDDKDGLKNHWQTEHRMKSPYICHLCSMRCNRHRELLEHMNRHREDGSQLSSRNSSGDIDSDNDLFACHLCSDEFDSRCRLDSHLLSHAGQRRRRRQRSYSCRLCVINFSDKPSRDDHMRAHVAGVRWFLCPRCPAKFSRSSSRQRHLRAHSDRRPYACGACPARFKQKPNLMAHLRTHRGERPYTCSVCCVDFSTAAHLKTHLARHSGDAWFCCSVCPARYRQPTGLQQHERTRHVGLLPHRCPVCSVGFKLARNLARHREQFCGRPRRLHACSVCKANFSSPAKLEAHMRSHSGELPFSCAMCPACFAHTSSRNKHMSDRHSGHCPHECSVCGAKFNKLKFLKHHARIHKGHIL